jgi:hypothetical protein
VSSTSSASLNWLRSAANSSSGTSTDVTVMRSAYSRTSFSSAENAALWQYALHRTPLALMRLLFRLGEHMSHVEVSARISMDADRLWQEVGSFQGVGSWHPMLARVEGQGEEPGAIRTAETPDGQKSVERLQHIDRNGHFYRYVILSSPMPVKDYVAELRVRSEDGSASTILWSSDSQVTSEDEEVVGMVREFFNAGVQNLKRKLS